MEATTNVLLGEHSGNIVPKDFTLTQNSKFVISQLLQNVQLVFKFCKTAVGKIIYQIIVYKLSVSKVWLDSNNRSRNKSAVPVSKFPRSMNN